MGDVKQHALPRRRGVTRTVERFFDRLRLIGGDASGAEIEFCRGPFERGEGGVCSVADCYFCDRAQFLDDFRVLLRDVAQLLGVGLQIDEHSGARGSCIRRFDGAGVLPWLVLLERSDQRYAVGSARVDPCLIATASRAG